ncbi:unnamed protein product, partial [Staurois parvus]
YTWYNAVRKVPFSWQLPNPDTSIRLVDRGVSLTIALTPLCHFTWPTTLWLSCCCCQLLPLYYNPTNS